METSRYSIRAIERSKEMWKIIRPLDPGTFFHHGIVDCGEDPRKDARASHSGRIRIG